MAEIMVRYDDLRRYCEKRHCGSVPLEYIKQMPTIEAEPVRHGRWIELPESWQADYECSECGAGIGTIKPPYCAICGAKMDADGGTISKERFAEIMRGADNE